MCINSRNAVVHETAIPIQILITIEIKWELAGLKSVERKTLVGIGWHSRLKCIAKRIVRSRYYLHLPLIIYRNPDYD